MSILPVLEATEWLWERLRPRKLLLVVEDNFADAELLCEELNALKIKYDWAKNAEKADGMLEKTSYSWALVDIGFPHKDGGTLADEIRDKYPKTKVWLVTGNSFVNLVPGKEMRIVRKPIKSDVLREMII